VPTSTILLPSGETALTHALRIRDMVMFLIENGGDVNVETNEKRMTPLSIAISTLFGRSRIRMIELLLSYGANPHGGGTRHEETPLGIAMTTIVNDVAVVMTLLNKGSRITAHTPSKYGHTALTQAVSIMKPRSIIPIVTNTW
jgi:ankyrin repeat protein